MSTNVQEITIVGNLVEEPTLVYTPSGTAVSNFTVAKNPRYYNAKTSEWEEGETLFVRCSVWRNAAENLAASNLPKGTRIVVMGVLAARSFETKDGEQRTVWEVTADEIGVSLKFADIPGVNKNVYEDEKPEPKTVAKPSPSRTKRAR